MEKSLVYYPFSSKEQVGEYLADKYSRFKHGCPETTRAFAHGLSDVIERDIVKRDCNKEIVIIGAPYNRVPVASSFLASHVARNLSDSLGRIVYSAKADRKHSYHTQYHDMSLQDRMKSLSGESFRLSPDHVKDRLVYFVDDIFITGSHEGRMKQLIERINEEYSIEFDYSFAYYMKLTNKKVDPTIEGWLNHYTINEDTVANVVNLIEDGNLFINTRVTKLLFSSDVKHFTKFARKAPKVILEGFKKSCEANDYHKHELYIENYKRLKRKLKC